MTINKTKNTGKRITYSRMSVGKKFKERVGERVDDRQGGKIREHERERL